MKKIKEEVIRLYCHKNLLKGKTYHDIENNIIKIIEQGVYNKFEGPDFKNFKIAEQNNEFVTTDIEVEKKIKDYYRHGHNTDKNYDKVKYIFVYDTGKNPVKISDKKIIILKNKIDRLSEKDIIKLKDNLIETFYKTDILQKLKSFEKEKIILTLIKFGEKRFYNKVTDLKELILKYGLKPGFIIKIIEAAGYIRNKYQFRKMSENINWNKIICKLNNATFNSKTEFLQELFNSIFYSEISELQHKFREYFYTDLNFEFKYFKVYPKSFPEKRIKLFLPIILKLLHSENIEFIKEYFSLNKMSEKYIWFRKFFYYNKLKIKIQNQKIRSFLYNAFLPFLKIYFPKKNYKNYLLDFPAITKYNIINYPINFLELQNFKFKEIHQQGLLYLYKTIDKT